MTEVERHSYDVVVIGAGGAGLRAAIEARERGLQGRARVQVPARQGPHGHGRRRRAAAMGNVYPKDNWQVHFRDTMRGGKFLNNWRMAELHAKEAPDRVWELEHWGALFDRTKDGKISQRDFGGHRYARLAHVGDRTGLEMIRTLQQKVVAAAGGYADRRLEAVIKVFVECTITELLKDGGPDRRGLRLLARDRRVRRVRGARRRAGHRRHRQVVEVHLELVGVHRRRPRAGPPGRGDADQHGVRPVPPDRDGLAAVGARHPGHRGRPRRRRRAAQLRGQAVHVRLHPECSQAETAETEEEADRWYDDNDSTTAAPPDLLPRDEVARAINSEVKAGRGTPHGGVFLDIASRRTPEYIKRRLPSMYHQFKELADVDITKEPMEVGPTCHYVMGGVEVDADTGAATVPGLFAAGEVSGGMHGANRLGGNSLSDLLVFGRRAGTRRRRLRARHWRSRAGGRRPTLSTPRRRWRSTPFEAADRAGENPYALHQRTAADDAATWSASSAPRTRSQRRWLELDGARKRGQPTCSVEGNRHTTRAGTSPSTCATCCWSAECVAMAALERAGEPRAATPATTIPDGPEWAQGQPDRARSRRRHAIASSAAASRDADAGRLLELLRDLRAGEVTPTESWPSMPGRRRR